MGSVFVCLTSLRKLVPKEPQNYINGYSSINFNGFLMLTDGEICTLGGLSEVWQKMCMISCNKDRTFCSSLGRR